MNQNTIMYMMQSIVSLSHYTFELDVIEDGAVL